MKKILFGAVAALALSAAAALAQVAKGAGSVEKPKIVIGVGGKSLLYYLPLTIAEQKGYFKEQGLDAEIIDFAGGAKSLQALIGGSVDVVAGAYEHTIHMQAKGQDIRATIDLGRYPAIVIAVRKDVKYDKPADLKGLKIGVTAPGSSTNMLAKYFLARNGLSPDDVAALVPENYLLGDKKLYMVSFAASRASYSQTGLIDAAAMKSALDMLVGFTPELKDAKIDLPATFDDRFAKKAAAGK